MTTTNQERINELKETIRAAKLEMQQLEGSQLEPCPFCGQRPVFVGGKYSSVMKCCMRFTIGGTQEEMIEKWNRRVIL